MTRARRVTNLIAVGAGAFALILCAGCYKKVVSAKGIGSSELHPNVQKPTTTITEDFGAAIMGDRNRKK